MKSIKFLQESFETKERFQQEISFKYSYNRNIIESIDSDNQIGFLLQATEL